MSSQPQQPQPTKKKIRPVIIIREARESDRDDIIHFEQSLAQETEGKTLDAASIKRGVELPLKTRHLARLWVACLPFKNGSSKNPADLMTPEEYNDLDEGSDQESHLANVGFLATGQQMDVKLGGMHNFLLSVFIEAPYRGCGIFKKLYKFVENTVLRDRLSVGMRLYVDKENTRAFETYQRLGMRKDHWEMWAWKKPKELLPAHAGGDVPLPSALNLPEQFPERYPWKIRLAEAADLPALVDLELRNAKETIKDPTQFHFDESSCKKGYAMAWACPELARVYVAEMTEQVPSDKEGGFFTINRIVGMVTVTNEYSEWNAGVMAWLTSIYVVPPLRTHGVFTSLFQFAKSEVMRDPNVVGIRMLTVGKDHADGERIYEMQRNLAKKIGMQQENYDLMTAIDPSSRTNLAEHFAGGTHMRTASSSGAHQQ